MKKVNGDGVSFGVFACGGSEIRQVIAIHRGDQRYRYTKLEDRAAGDFRQQGVGAW